MSASERERSSFTTVMLIIPGILRVPKRDVLTKQNIQKHKAAARSTSDKTCTSALMHIPAFLFAVLH